MIDLFRQACLHCVHHVLSRRCPHCVSLVLRRRCQYTNTFLYHSLWSRRGLRRLRLHCHEIPARRWINPRNLGIAFFLQYYLCHLAYRPWRSPQYPWRNNLRAKNGWHVQSWLSSLLPGRPRNKILPNYSRGIVTVKIKYVLINIHIRRPLACVFRWNKAWYPTWSSFKPSRNPILTLSKCFGRSGSFGTCTHYRDSNVRTWWMSGFVPNIFSNGVHPTIFLLILFFKYTSYPIASVQNIFNGAACRSIVFAVFPNDWWGRLTGFMCELFGPTLLYSIP